MIITRRITSILFIGGLFSIALMGFNTESKTDDSTRDSVKTDPNTGFIIADGYELVTAHCTGCHSSKLVTQYRGNKQDWLNKIRWMQQKQKLWDLGESEPVILDYLAKNYPAVERVDRRSQLKNIEWYKLNR